MDTGEEKHLKYSIQDAKYRQNFANGGWGQAQTTEMNGSGEKERLDGSKSNVHKGEESIICCCYDHPSSKKFPKRHRTLIAIFPSGDGGLCYG